jgi:hypothetical protein
VNTTVKGYTVSFSGKFAPLKGREGFAITNARVSGDVKVQGNPGTITVFSGVNLRTRELGPAYVTQGSVTITPYKDGGGLFGGLRNSIAGAVATQTIQGGHPKMLDSE